LKLVGYKLQNGQYCIDAILKCPTLGIKENVTFIVDTGAVLTVINDVDVIILGIDYSDLSHVEKGKGIVGIESLRESPLLESFRLPISTLIFIDEDGVKTISEPLDNAYVLRHNEIHDRIKESNLLFELHYHHDLPSILGLDVLRNYKIHFTDFKVILETNYLGLTPLE
jgi:hypothetical protein